MTLMQIVSRTSLNLMVTDEYGSYVLYRENPIVKIGRIQVNLQSLEFRL